MANRCGRGRPVRPTLWVALMLLMLLGGAMQMGRATSRQTMLAFRRGEQLWVASANGSGARRISTPSEQVVTRVGFSPKAGLLAWWSIVGETRGRPRYALRVRPATGGVPRTIFEDAQARYRETDAPSFTADGRLIVFGRATGEFGAGEEVRDWGLWQVGLDGKHVKRLTRGFGTRGGSRAPQVSPDGKWIAFCGYLAEEASRLCFLRRATGRVTQTDVWMEEFSWSPASDFVVVTRSGDKDPYTLQLARYDLRRKTATALTDYAPEGRLLSGPAISPRGLLVAFGALIDKGSWVNVIPLPRQVARTRLAHTDANLRGLDLLAWSPAGDRLFYTNYDEATSVPGIWVMHPDGTCGCKVLSNATLAGVYWR
jgi:hypothetical protein